MKSILLDERFLFLSIMITMILEVFDFSPLYENLFSQVNTKFVL